MLCEKLQNYFQLKSPSSFVRKGAFQLYKTIVEKLISRFRKPKAVSKDNKPTLAHKLWEKYGIVGLGFLGTFTVGAPVSIAVGVGFNVNMHKLASWCCIGVLARCAVFTLVGHFGMKLF